MRGPVTVSAPTQPPVDRSEAGLAARYGRDAGPLSARNSSKGALLAEAHAVFRLLGAGATVAEAQAACLSGRVLHQRAWQTRRRIWHALNQRYFAWNPPQWVLADLADAARGATTDARFVGLAYLHYARRDRLTFEFVTEKLFARWSARNLRIRRDDVLDFLADCAEREPAVRRWRETTRKKLAGNLLTALRDFGLLVGVQRKKIQRPAVRPQVALHLWRLLDWQGLRGRALLEAPDWRLFLWDSDDVQSALARVELAEEARQQG